jgi:folate-dependent phosphoribosylglycinamide formyltransferase PurN
MKITLLCGDAPNQRALANLLHEEFEIKNLVIWSPSVNESGKSRSRLVTLNKLLSGVFNFSYRKSWFRMLEYFESKYISFPIQPLLVTSNVNNKEVMKLFEGLNDSLVVVSGTNLLSRDLINVLPVSSRIVNLHTGISPYVKGGPNCTNWCLANDKISRIGNSVMWIDSGIDSGNLIVTEKTDLEGVSSLLELHVKVMMHAHDLYLRAIRKILTGQPVPSISQKDFTESNLYLTRDWTVAQQAKGLLNFWFRFKILGNIGKENDVIHLVRL